MCGIILIALLANRLQEHWTIVPGVLDYMQNRRSKAGKKHRMNVDPLRKLCLECEKQLDIMCLPKGIGQKYIFSSQSI